MEQRRSAALALSVVAVLATSTLANCDSILGDFEIAAAPADAAGSQDSFGASSGGSSGSSSGAESGAASGSSSGDSGCQPCNLGTAVVGHCCLP
jgi:hypothetical protein